MNILNMQTILKKILLGLLQYPAVGFYVLTRIKMGDNFHLTFITCLPILEI